jgi:hypothetical protein
MSHRESGTIESDIINEAKGMVPNARETLELAIERIKETKGDGAFKGRDPWEIAEELITVTGEIFEEKLNKSREYGEKRLKEYGFGTRRLSISLANLAKQHGGETVEEIFAFILNMYNISYTRKVNVGTRDFPAEADFVVPSQDTRAHMKF